MYIVIGTTRYDDVSRVISPTSCRYTGTSVVDIIPNEEILRYRDDGFLIGKDDPEDYLRSYGTEDGFVLTNLPELTAKFLTPREHRESIYSTERIIEYQNELLTVDDANRLYLQYAAEGNTSICEKLQKLIATTKNNIRKQYPDETEV